MESHHLVKSPILLGARKRLRRYLSTDSRRGGGGCWKKKKLAQYVFQYCWFVLVSYVFLQISSLVDLFSILPLKENILTVKLVKPQYFLYVSICICYLFICYHFSFMFLLAIFITLLSWCQYSWPTLAWRAQRLRHHY